MAEYRLLEDLAALSREDERAAHQRLDERWDDLCRERLSAEERQALAAEAEGSELGELAWKAFQPPSQAFKERLVDSIIKGATEEQPASPPMPSRRSYLRRPATWLAAALFAALTTWGSLLTWRASGPLQVYVWLVESQGAQDNVLRGKPGEPKGGDELEVPEGSVVTHEPQKPTVLGLVAKEDSRSVPKVRLYFYRDSILRRWESGEDRLEKAGKNLRFEGTFDLDLEKGPWELIAVYGRRWRALPDEVELRRILQGPPTDPQPNADWKIARLPIKVQHPNL